MKRIAFILAILFTYNLSYSQVYRQNESNKKFLKDKYRFHVDKFNNNEQLEDFFNDKELPNLKLLIGTLRSDKARYINNVFVGSSAQQINADIDFESKFNIELYDYLDSLNITYDTLERSLTSKLLTERSLNLLPLNSRINTLSQIAYQSKHDFLLLFIPCKSNDFFYGYNQGLKDYGLYRFPNLYFVFAGHDLVIFDLKSDTYEIAGTRKQMSGDNSSIPYKKKLNKIGSSEIEILKTELAKRVQTNIKQTFDYIGLD